MVGALRHPLQRRAQHPRLGADLPVLGEWPQRVLPTLPWPLLPPVPLEKRELELEPPPTAVLEDVPLLVPKTQLGPHPRPQEEVPAREPPRESVEPDGRPVGEPL